MKFLPTKQYHIVPGGGLEYRDHKNVSTNWPKFTAHKTFPPKNTRYTVSSILIGSSLISELGHFQS